MDIEKLRKRYQGPMMNQDIMDCIEEIEHYQMLEQDEAKFMEDNGIRYNQTFIDGWVDLINERDELKKEIEQLKEWIKISDRLPPPHVTVLAKCTNGDIYQARVCYGLHEPFWCGHSELNFGIILRERSLEVECWKEVDYER